MLLPLSPAWNMIPVFILPICHLSPWNCYSFFSSHPGAGFPDNPQMVMLLSVVLYFTFPHCTFCSFHLFIYVSDYFCFSHKMVNSRKVRAIILFIILSPVSWLVQLSALKWYWNENSVMFCLVFFFPLAKQSSHKCNGKVFCVDRTEFILSPLSSPYLHPLNPFALQALAEQEIGHRKKKGFFVYILLHRL